MDPLQHPPLLCCPWTNRSLYPNARIPQQQPPTRIHLPTTQQQEQPFASTTIIPAALLPVVSSSRPTAVVTPCHYYHSSSSSSSSSSLPSPPLPPQQDCHCYYPSSTRTTATTAAPTTTSVRRNLFANANPRQGQDALLSLSEYRLVVLERSNLQQRWGLEVILTNGKVQLGVSSLTTTTLRAAWQTQAPHPLTWSWWRRKQQSAATATPPPTANTNTATAALHQEEEESLLQQFVQGQAWQATSSLVASGALVNGGTLVAINGHVLAGPVHDLEDHVLPMFHGTYRLCLLLVWHSSLPKHTPIASKKVRKRCINNNNNNKHVVVRPPILYRNPLFPDPKEPTLGLPFVDNCLVDDDDDVEDGQRSKLFIKPVENVTTWLRERKRKWRTMYDTNTTSASNHNYQLGPRDCCFDLPPLYRNPLFFADRKDPTLGLPFDDDWEYDLDEGQRAALFVKPIDNINTWLQERKRKWRSMYNVTTSAHDDDEEEEEEDWNEEEEDRGNVAVDFWTRQGFVGLHDWLRKRTTTWRQGYSWQRAKRQRIQHDVTTAVVSLSPENFSTWLRVRKTQWRWARRQRQRAAAATTTSTQRTTANLTTVDATSVVNADVLLLDSLLEEKEERERQRQERDPLDISFLFDSDSGCPDDVVAHCLRFLEIDEHGKLMALNRETRKKLGNREVVWRLLCPSHWTLPRRPRQAWYVLYWTKLQAEHQEARKRGDELLVRALNIMTRGDHVASLERLVKKAEKDGKFDVNYSSGVVCERNSLLNLAVIHERHKIARWLVESKGAHIESEDRGRFTPLLNAAWAGDKVMVRFLLAHGANRRHVGTSHYTRPLSPPDFEGRTAAEWAEFRGKNDIAQLIRLGL